MDLKPKSVLTQNEIKSLIGEKAYAQALEKFNKCGKFEISNGRSSFEIQYIDEDLERDLIYYSLIPINGYKGENTFEYIRQHSATNTANR